MSFVFSFFQDPACIRLLEGFDKNKPFGSSYSILEHVFAEHLNEIENMTLEESTRYIYDSFSRYVLHDATLLAKASPNVPYLQRRLVMLRERLNPTILKNGILVPDYESRDRNLVAFYKHMQRILEPYRDILPKEDFSLILQASKGKKQNESGYLDFLCPKLLTMQPEEWLRTAKEHDPLIADQIAQGMHRCLMYVDYETKLDANGKQVLIDSMKVILDFMRNEPDANPPKLVKDLWYGQLSKLPNDQRISCVMILQYLFCSYARTIAELIQGVAQLPDAIKGYVDKIAQKQVGKSIDDAVSGVVFHLTDFQRILLKYRLSELKFNDLPDDVVSNGVISKFYNIYKEKKKKEEVKQKMIQCNACKEVVVLAEAKEHMNVCPARLNSSSSSSSSSSSQ